MSTVYNITLEDNKKLEFVLTRKKMRNIVMRIKADGTIAVSAPHYANLNDITSFIISKLGWIEQTKNKLVNTTNQIRYLPQEIVSGQTLILLGEIYSLQIVPSEIQGVFLQDKKIFIHTRQFENAELSKKIFYRWLDKYTLATFEHLLNNCYQKLATWEIPRPQLIIRRMKSSWGLCRLREQSITLNSNLIHTPLSCIEYVVWHELTHLKHFNHSKDFYALLSCICPDWKVQKTILKKYSASLKK